MPLSDDLAFVDTETVGLELDHDIWEIAFAIGDRPISVSQVDHSLRNADPKALELNGYYDRMVSNHYWLNDQFIMKALTGKTLVGANPSFDAYRLQRRWGRQVWHYRLVDVESMAVSVFDLNKPLGLKGLVDKLRERGYDIPENDHSAGGDVDTTREVYKALREIGRNYVKQF
jgi:hypothetical protein